MSSCGLAGRDDRFGFYSGSEEYGDFEYVFAAKILVRDKQREEFTLMKDCRICSTASRWPNYCPPNTSNF
jgi:hypothetical protein